MAKTGGATAGRCPGESCRESTDANAAAEGQGHSGSSRVFHVRCPDAGGVLASLPQLDGGTHRHLCPTPPDLLAGGPHLPDPGLQRREILHAGAGERQRRLASSQRLAGVRHPSPPVLPPPSAARALGLHWLWSLPLSLRRPFERIRRVRRPDLLLLLAVLSGQHALAPRLRLDGGGI